MPQKNELIIIAFLPSNARSTGRAIRCAYGSCKPVQLRCRNLQTWAKRSCSSFLPSLERVGRLNGRGGADLEKALSGRYRVQLSQRESVANA